MVPIFAIKFFDDLSTAEAWLTLNGFTTETIAEYVSILKYRRAEDFSEGRYPPPLTALHIPPEALKDRAVNERAQASLASIVVYLLSRELGFFYLGPSEIKATVLSTAHRPKAKLVMEQKGIHRSPEGARILQSDAFALEIMRRAGVPPTGLAIYFSAQAHWAPNEADFSSRQGYLHYWHSTPEYEVFSERLYQIASLMLDSRKEYARRQDDRDSSIRQIEQSARAIFRLHDVMEMSSVQQMENKRRALKQSTDDLQPRPKEGRN